MTIVTDYYYMTTGTTLRLYDDNCTTVTLRLYDCTTVQLLLFDCTKTIITTTVRLQLQL